MPDSEVPDSPVSDRLTKSPPYEKQNYPVLMRVNDEMVMEQAQHKRGLHSSPRRHVTDTTLCIINVVSCSTEPLKLVEQIFQSKNASSVKYVQKKCETKAQVMSPTLAHRNSKNKQNTEESK